MSRSITTRNLNHPHNRLNAYRQSVFVSYRRLSRVELDQLRAREGIELALTRKQKLDEIVERFVARWKQEFETVNGFPFDDIYQPAKLTKHLADAEERRALLVKDAIDHRPMRAGVVISREEFNALSSEEQDVVRAELHERILKINASGYAGVLGNGVGIVDRRLHPEALPVPENPKFGVPKPLPI